MLHHLGSGRHLPEQNDYDNMQLLQYTVHKHEPKDSARGKWEPNLEPEPKRENHDLLDQYKGNIWITMFGS